MKDFSFDKALEILDVLIWILKVQTTHMIYTMSHKYLAKNDIFWEISSDLENIFGKLLN